MRHRKSPRFVVLAVLLLFTFGTPTREQEANACPLTNEVRISYIHRVTTCHGDPPLCVEWFDTRGAKTIFCDGSSYCDGDCNRFHAEYTWEENGKDCPFCPPVEP